MKILRILLTIIGSIVALLLITALFVSKDMNYQQSVTINAPMETVWENVNSLADLDKWSPWNEKDPNMKKSMSGTDGTVGAKQSWESDKEDVGVGSQTITKLEPSHTMLTELKFMEPWESEAQSFVKLEADGSGTKATWGFESQMPYPMNLMGLFMDMEDQIGPDYKKGLNKLKALCEN